MPSFLTSLARRLTPADMATPSGWARIAPVAAFHLAALAVMIWSEAGPNRMAAFLLTWGVLNFLWLALLRRPALSAALSFAMLVILVMVSRFKFEIVGMTASFVDVMVIDSDTFAFLWQVFPHVRAGTVAGVAVALPIAWLLWRTDPYRMRRRMALAGAAACFVALTGLALAVPMHPGEAFGDGNYFSGFARSGVDAVSAYMAEGFSGIGSGGRRRAAPRHR